MLNSRAMMIGAIGRPGAPHRATDLDPEHFIFLAEALLREGGEENWKQVESLYDAAYSRRRRKADSHLHGEARARALEAFMADVLG